MFKVQVDLTIKEGQYDPPLTSTDTLYDIRRDFNADDVARIQAAIEEDVREALRSLLSRQPILRRRADAIEKALDETAAKDSA